VQPQTKDADQTLILAHRRELVQQAARHCETAYSEKSVEIEMGETQASGAADITVASVRSLVSGDRLKKLDPSRFKLILVDEAHHIVAPGYMQILEHFGLEMPRETGPALVGVSATFSRFDGLRLGAAIDHIVYHKDYIDMIGEKWLADVMFTTVKSRANLSKVKVSNNGDFATAQLSKAVNTPQNNEIAFKAWQAEACNRKSTLVFCVDLEHVSNLTSVFRQHGIDAQYITGSTKKRLRGERLDAFRNRTFPVLLNCGVFTEGTDIPNIDCVLLARPTRSRNLLVQMIGRGMRLYPGKGDCHVIDMVSSLETGIVSVPTLFGLDPSEIVEKATPTRMKELKNCRLDEQGSMNEYARTAMGWPSPSPDVSDYRLTFTHYDTVQDLIDDTSGERHIRALSHNAWVQTDDSKFVLTAKSGVLTVELDRDDQKFLIVYKATLPPSPSNKSKAPFTRPRTIATSTTLSDAVHSADTFAASHFERIFINGASEWRLQPASEGQLAFLNRFRGDEEPLTAEQVTKGKAADMLTKWKHGAKGRFDKMLVKKRKEEREVAKVEEMRKREEVAVGPLEA
jgi:ATP-dependent helicase IRC3